MVDISNTMLHKRTSEGGWVASHPIILDQPLLCIHTDVYELLEITFVWRLESHYMVGLVIRAAE